MKYSILPVILVSIILPLLLKARDPDTQADDHRVVFSFSKAIKAAALLGLILVSGCSLLFLGFAAYDLKEEDRSVFLFAVLFFSFMILLLLLVYLFVRNKRIICQGNELYVYNIWGRERIFRLQDIVNATELPSDGMVLTFRDHQKCKIDSIMNNYPKIKEILRKNKSSLASSPNGQHQPGHDQQHADHDYAVPPGRGSEQQRDTDD